MKAHEKGNGNAPKPTSSKAGAVVVDAKETAPIKSEQVRFSTSIGCILAEQSIRYCKHEVIKWLFLLNVYLHSVRVA